jgi:hypothetical protein
MAYNVKSRRIRWTRHVTHVQEMRNAHKILAGRPERKRPYGRE